MTDDSIEFENSTDSVNIPRFDQFFTSSSLPVIATYNARSLPPKIKSLKTDLVERFIDVAFIQEIWENDKEEYRSEIEKNVGI